MDREELNKIKMSDKCCCRCRFKNQADENYTREQLVRDVFRVPILRRTCDKFEEKA